MPAREFTRRRITTSAPVIAAGAMLAATMPAPASAEQGNMEAALADLNDAVASLKVAEPNKGGHRERAIALVQQAIAEVEAGIRFAAG